MRIGSREVGPGHPAFIIAELSCNHSGSYAKAEALVAAAHEAGADAVKLQHDDPDGGITIDCDNEWFQIKDGPWEGRTLYDLYRETYTPWHWILKLKPYAESLGMECFSTPSSVGAVEYLEHVGVPCYKVSSFEARHVPLLEAIAATDKTALVSLGCSDGDDRSRLREIFGAKRCIPMHCVSDYPAKADDMSLSTISYLRDLGWPAVGLSDHTLSLDVPALGVVAGASVIEKHLMLDDGEPTLDDGFSFIPEEFAVMVSNIRDAEAAYKYRARTVSTQFCSSIFVTSDVKAGERFTEHNVSVIRPGYGMHPKEYRRVIGMVAKMDIARGTPLTESML